MGSVPNLSSRAIATDGAHCRESTGTGPVVLKAVPVMTGAAFSGFTMDHFLMRLSFPTPTVVGMQGICALQKGIRGGFFAVEQGIRPGWVLAPLLFNIFFAAFINVAHTRFKADKYFMDALAYLRKRVGAGGAGGSNRRRASPGYFAVRHTVR